MKQLITQKPVSLSGVLVPRRKLKNGWTSDYKLACSSGLEYFIEADAEWREQLSYLSWEEVRVIGLLNVSDMTLIPRKVFRNGPKGERENVIQLAAWKGRDLMTKLVTRANELVFVPVALCALWVL